MDWHTLLSAKRFGLEEYHRDHPENRSEFQRDYDRLIFSAPFRRLQNKTQVFPLPGSIFVHNRLTHSLEVASVGRSLGNDVARLLVERHPELRDTFVPEIGAIVSAACLAHDLGNPPFGHSGERAISTFFSEGKGLSLRDIEVDGTRLTPGQWEDLTHFEGNANAFRLLTHQFEGRRKGGFVLTYSTLAAIVKYPYASSLAGGKSKFGFFTTEEEGYRRIAAELGIPRLQDSPLRCARHPLVYLVEAADDICYQIMDIEDAYKLKLLTLAETRRAVGAAWTPCASSATPTSRLPTCAPASSACSSRSVSAPLWTTRKPSWRAPSTAPSSAMSPRVRPKPTPVAPPWPTRKSTAPRTCWTSSWPVSASSAPCSN